MNVELANEAKVTSSASGSLERRAGGRTIILRKVYFIPTLNANLISCSRLDENGITINTLESQCCLFNGRNKNKFFG